MYKSRTQRRSMTTERLCEEVDWIQVFFVMFPSFFAFGVIAFLLLCFDFVASLECRPQGPIFPKPSLATSTLFQNAVKQLTGILDSAVNGTIKAGWDINSTTISVALVSRDQLGPGLPIWEYHHLAPYTFLGTKVLGRNTQYQIGSISKAITDAIVIKSGINLDDLITKYLPGLDGASLIPWNSITLRALASHLAGIPPNCEYST
jgi:CubicO group peptidase (beta-lactamase class C family)